MNQISEMFRRLRALFFARQEDRASQEEFSFHIDLETERNLALGMNPQEARRRALAAFGSRSATLAFTRDARGVRLVEDVFRDLSLAVRQLRRQAAFSVTMVLIIALGVGAVTAIWSVVDGVLLRPVAVDLDRLVMIWQTDRASDNTREPSSWPDFKDVQRQAKSFAATAAFFGLEPTLLLEAGERIRLQGVATTEEASAGPHL